MDNNFFNAVEFSHLLLNKNIEPGDIVVDATSGNGHDTEFMADLVGESGKVYSFDIQEIAINNTKNLIKENGLEKRVQLIQDSHANLDQYIKTELTAVVFNLGYLPGGNKEIITKSQSTIKAIKKSLNLIKKNGIIVMVIYSGHPGGEEEEKEILNYVAKLDYKRFNVVNYEFINQPDSAPRVLALKKRK